MGVNSLWDILGPTAKPVRLESLSRKKLAVDASIWIYQFLKAVRDAEGNALPQSHIVGFFRRICKLLYYGIMPVFVFDGGAPIMKKQTIADRRARREDKTESVIDTARKLLAIQVQRQAQSKPKKQAQSVDSEEYVFLEDLSNSGPSQEVKETDFADTAFRKKDEYHLPTITEFKVKSDDQRIMPEEEFDELSTRIWNQIEETELGEIDPDSKEFQNLPLPVQYMLISHLRLKSRLRMGYSKDQLEKLFPDSMEFSKFQIQQVQKRNFYTQKLMDVSGMGENGNTTRRIAGDKDRKYALVKNDDGWTLSLEESDPHLPINVDDQEYGEQITFNGTTSKNDDQTEGEEEESDWDDVPLEDDEPKEQQDFDKALIASIYDQYENSHASNAEDEGRLKKAIEESKKDFYNLRNQEKKMLESGILSWGDAPVSESAQNKKPDEEAIPKKLLMEEPFFSLNQSVLFNPPEGHEEPKSDGNDTSQTKVDDKGRETILLDPIDETMNPKIDDLAEEYAESFDDSDDKNDTGKTSDKGNAHKPINTIPSWFGNDVASNNPHTILYDREYLADGDKKYQSNIDEEESGLLSWTEAQDLLSRNMSKEHYVTMPDGDNDDGDIIIIDDQNDKTKGFTSKKNLSSSVEKDSLKKSQDNHKHELTGKEGLGEFKNPHEAPRTIENIEEKKRTKRHEEPEVVVIDDDVNGSIRSKKANDMDNAGVSGTETRKVPPLSIEARNSKRRPQLYDYDFIDREEELLADQWHEEEEDHLTFVSQIRENENIPIQNTKITNEALLHEQMLKAKRDSDEPTQNMISDVQELLKRFGIPYIIAPMEAEAQCAELMRLGLVDGIITDDSDCFLFGGDKVYKNMFNQKKYVECYSQQDIKSHLGLTQHNLIELALLLGSDYTRGVKGIGPVLAVEILAEFGLLQKFKEWFDTSIHTTKPPDKSRLSSLQKNLLNRVKNGSLYLLETFPDMAVFDAYKRPEVDCDTTPFKWGMPNLNEIRSYLIYNVGWTQSRVDEVMVPLIRDINRKKSEGTQSTISEFFPQEFIRTRKDIGLGKRIKAATERLSKRQKN